MQSCTFLLENSRSHTCTVSGIISVCTELGQDPMGLFLDAQKLLHIKLCVQSNWQIRCMLTIHAHVSITMRVKYQMLIFSFLLADVSNQLEACVSLSVSWHYSRPVFMKPFCIVLAAVIWAPKMLFCLVWLPMVFDVYPTYYVML